MKDKRIAYKDNMKTVVDKINSVLDEIIDAIGDYPSLKDYIEGLTGGIKGTVQVSPEGVTIPHNLNTMEYQVVVTANDNVAVWRDKAINTVTLYSSELATVDYAIMSTTDALKLIRDNAQTVQEVVDARAGYNNLKERLDVIAEQIKNPAGVTIKRHVIKALQDQTLFSLPSGNSYVPGTNSITVYIDGVKQRSNLDFSELSTTQIRFTEPLGADWSVELIWFDFKPILTQAHASRHGLGGGDEIRLHGLQIISGTIPDSAMESKYIKSVAMNNPPKTGKWSKGDLILNSNPKPGGYIGWVCTDSGEFGTWNKEPVFKPYGLISN